MNLIYTIQGSGTHSLKKMLGIEQIIHCEDVLKWDEWGDVVSTYRDPCLVGATWVNRYACALDSHPREDIGKLWRESWSNWAESSDKMTIHYVNKIPYQENKTNDRMGIRKAYESGDMDAYYTMVPKSFIDHANECIGRVYG